MINLMDREAAIQEYVYEITQKFQKITGVNIFFSKFPSETYHKQSMVPIQTLI